MREFRHFCQNWAELFKSQKTFDNFVDFNESFFAEQHSGKRGWKTISESSDASYEAIQNFMTDAFWDPDEFNLLRIENLQHNKKLAMKSSGAISLDDVEKICYGECDEYVDYQYSSSMGKPVKSIKFVNAHYHDEQKDYHLFFEPYQINKNVVLSPEVLKCIDASAMVAKLTSNQQFQAVVKLFLTEKKSSDISLKEIKSLLEVFELPNKEKKAIISKFKKLSPDFKSKIDIAIDSIKKVAEKWCIEGKIFTMDCWYASMEIFKIIIELKASFIAQARTNRIISTKELGRVSGDPVRSEKKM